MSNRRRRRINKSKAPAAPIVSADAGMVLTVEGSDVPLNPDSMIDLEAMSAGGKTPSFRTRKADPMRPFMSKPVDAAYVRGGMAAFAAYGSGVPLHNDTKVADLPRGKDGKIHLRVSRPDGSNLVNEAVPPDTVEEILGLLNPLRPDQRSRVIGGLKKKFGENFDRAIPPEELPPQTRRASAEVVKELFEMSVDPKLQKLGESCFHKCVEAWKSGAVIVPNRASLPADLQAEAGESWFEGAQVFVVQHDWAAAFKNSEEFGQGAWNLPYPITVFEFRISKHRCVLALIVGDGYFAEHNKDMRPHRGIFNIETSQGWVMGGMLKFSEDGSAVSTPSNMPNELMTLTPVVGLAATQARAICITLEAEVAVTEVVRAPHRLNQKRERHGQLPIYDYHVVDLAHRKRYAPRLPEPGDIDTEHRHRRLHWVRAHVRRYPNHTVPIKWHLRGDPDLGFVDKEYRL